MKIVVLDAVTLGSDISWDVMKAFGSLTLYPVSAPEEIPSRVADADVVVTNKCRLNEKTLAGAGKLRLVLEAATGFDNIDTAYCRDHGIAVANVKGYSTTSVMQLTLAMAFSLSTKLGEYREYCADGRYTRAGLFTQVEPVWNELAGKTWGIVGAGTIGGGVAKVAAALGCEVITWQRRPSALYPTVSIEELLSRADVVSLHVPLNDGTRGLISAERLTLMKPGAILINVARGPIVDEAAVAQALLDGRLGGFGCDAFSPEPFPEDHPYQAIKALPNVILTPHMGWASREARERLMEELVKNLSDFNEGKERNRIV
ncbi:MAG: hydroxyacid dehydrogenase [Lachnospiraceae bacterium]|nr:hydroxyacid dehydrogenase [Lachnospiraceae bacterium]